MAEGDSSDTVSLNSTIRELIGEQKGQKEEISSLRQEVRGQAVNVSSEVTKFYEINTLPNYGVMLNQIKSIYLSPCTT